MVRPMHTVDDGSAVAAWILGKQSCFTLHTGMPIRIQTNDMDKTWGGGDGLVTKERHVHRRCLSCVETLNAATGLDHQVGASRFDLSLRADVLPD